MPHEWHDFTKNDVDSIIRINKAFHDGFKAKYVCGSSNGRIKKKWWYYKLIALPGMVKIIDILLSIVYWKLDYNSDNIIL